MTGKSTRKSNEPIKDSKLMPEANGVVYLSGGNPQIAKADGDGPVQAYIAAMPEWKSDVGQRLDELIVCAVTCNSAIVGGCPRQPPLSPFPLGHHDP